MSCLCCTSRVAVDLKKCQMISILRRLDSAIKASQASALSTILSPSPPEEDWQYQDWLDRQMQNTSLCPCLLKV